MGLEDLAGKTVLVDFWATWCPPCVLEVPELNAVSAALEGSDAQVLAISIDADPAERLRAWASEHGVLYPVALGDITLAQRFGALEFPTHLILGPDGRVRETLSPGYHDRDELLALVDRHIERSSR